MKVEIRYVSGEVIYSREASSLKEAVESAVREGISLSSATLYNADLRDADLCDADLCGATLYNADLRDADLRDADLCDADLRGADLRGADLRGADLCDADLRGADLCGAMIENGEKIVKTQIQISTLQYIMVTIFDRHMLIGCEFHKISAWRSFDDKRILKMGKRKDLEWWHRWKEPILQICEVEGRT